MAGSEGQPKGGVGLLLRNGNMGMLMLNVGSKLLAMVVIMVVVGTTKEFGSQKLGQKMTTPLSAFRSRRALREVASPVVCPFDFSETPFPLTQSLCLRSDIYSESCCAAIKSDFWVPTFGVDATDIPEECIAAVESRLLQDQIRLQYSQVCGESNTFVSDPMLGQGERSGVAMQTEGEGEQGPRFEVVVSQLMYSEESEEEIPSDTRPEEEDEGEFESDHLDLRTQEADSLSVQPLGHLAASGTELQPFILRKKGKRSQADYDFEGVEPSILNDLAAIPVVASV